MPRYASHADLQQVLDRLTRIEQALATNAANGVGARTAEPARLLTVQDLATFLRTSPKAVRLMRDRGQLPAPIRLGDSRRLLWRAIDVAEWLDRTESRRSDRSR